MELSKCRICGERHRLGGCPESVARATALGDAKRREKSSDRATESSREVQSGKGRRKSDNRPAEAVQNVHQLPEVPMDGPSETDSGAPQPRGEPARTNPAKIAGSPNKRGPRGSFDRNAYQRDLMRKRRQAEKRESSK